MTNVEKRRWPHLWAVLVAALAPLLAIGFAFSLGPSPRKQLTQLDQRSETEARSLLSELGPHAVPALVEVLSATDTPHRVLVADMRYPATMWRTYSILRLEMWRQEVQVVVGAGRVR